jgi:hypothetical protein|tara:strand:+ start:5227 stop:5475 length:249 start_codon:yes stop_codon:yes gene_type:complete
MRTKQGINDLIKGIMLEGSVNVTNLESTANRIIEALTEENNLIIPDVSNFVIQEIERRRDLILSEPDGIVREQMINDLALEL